MAMLDSQRTDQIYLNTILFCHADELISAEKYFKTVK